MTILPIAYWGDIEYFARLVRGGGECVIDIREHYIKRSLRNRTEIMTANGTMPLSVCLQHADRPRTPVCDVRIDYSKRWQHQHWTAICSAYRSSPYFDMIADRIARFYEREWKYLVDYDLEIIRETLSLLNIEPGSSRSPKHTSNRRRAHATCDRKNGKRRSTLPAISSCSPTACRSHRICRCSTC